MRRQQWVRFGVIAAGIAVGAGSGSAADMTATGAAVEAVSAASDRMTMTLDEVPIAQFMKAFEKQTGRSYVVSPEVTGKATARLNNTQWQEALDVVLKPCGYGYYLQGDTVIVCAADKVPGAAAGGAGAVKAPPEPLVSQTFHLKYLDASDVVDLLKSQLSPQGRVSKVSMASQTWLGDSGWGSSGRGGGSGGTAESLGRLRRDTEKPDIVKGKTIVVVDTKAVIDRIASMLASVDVMPQQILIEAKFIEVRTDFLRDLGVEFGTGGNGAQVPGVTPVNFSGNGNLFGAGAQQINGTVKPMAFEPQASYSGTRPYDGGLSLMFQKLTEAQFQVLLRAMQEDHSYNVLSSPRLLTLNNQDATIIVGEKFPIINSQTTGSGGTTPTVSTSLEYYENIGVQLKVLPQICEGDLINLIVHPSVREQVGLSSGKIGTGAGANVSLTEYPVLSTRETETQILLKSGQTVVIGGLLKDKKLNSTVKVPFLGSIPLLGVLFRRDTITTEKTDLLIFLTATVRPVPDGVQASPLSSAKPGDTVTAEADALKGPKTP